MCGEGGSVCISRARLLLDMDGLRDRISCRRALLRMACSVMPRGCFPTDGQLKYSVDQALHLGLLSLEVGAHSFDI